MLVLAIGMDDYEVVLLPVVALAVVDLVALALEDVEVRLVLMAVAVVAPTRLQLDEVDLQGLGEKGLVTRPEHPPGARLAFIGVARMADARVVGDRAGAADPRRAALTGTELLQPIGLRADAAQERAAVLTHALLLRDHESKRRDAHWYGVRVRPPRARPL